MPITLPKVCVRQTRLDIPVTWRALTAASIALSMCSCASFQPADSFQSVDPAGRLHAASKAAAANDKSAIPDLVGMLSSDDPAERLVAIGTLERLTGERLGYDPAGSPSSRSAAIQRWNKQVAERSGEGNDPATVERGSTDR